MQPLQFSAITTDPLLLPAWQEKKIHASVLRLDKLHPDVSGNKFFKLRYYLDEARQLGKSHIITYGGAWSNHIAATAAACQLYGFSCTGIIRGERPAMLSRTLETAAAMGMELIFLSRTAFTQHKRTGGPGDTNQYIIPEGGYGKTGAAGAATITKHTDIASFTHICCAAGTGTMTAGLLMQSNPPQQVISISVLKNNLSLEPDILALLENNNPGPVVIHDYHFGGYAKHTPALLQFMNEWYARTGIPSDFVYTGKLFFAINNLVEKNFFPPGSRLLLVHSGGLQGNASLRKGTLIF